MTFCVHELLLQLHRAMVLVFSLIYQIDDELLFPRYSFTEIAMACHKRSSLYATFDS